VFAFQLFEVVPDVPTYIHQYNLFFTCLDTLHQSLIHGIESFVHPARTPLVITSHVVVEGLLEPGPILSPLPDRQLGVLAILERPGRDIGG